MGERTFLRSRKKLLSWIGVCCFLSVAIVAVHCSAEERMDESEQRWQQSQGNESLRALLRGVIDYAGIFKPADLTLDDAFHRYLSYRYAAQDWMLSKFIIPTKRLRELDPFAEEILRQPEPICFALLLRGGESRQLFLENLEDDVADIRMFQDNYSAHVNIDALEVRLPKDLLSRPSHGAYLDFFHAVNTAISSELKQGSRSQVFYEIPFAAMGRDQLRDFLGALQDHNKKWGEHHSKPDGVKLRCGGLEPAAFPSCKDLAKAIVSCCKAKVPFKATAGLHHPIRHENTSFGAPAHGFINLLLAGVVASDQSNDFDEELIRELLEDRDVGHFVFTDEAAMWRGTENLLRIPVAVVRKGRQNAVLSFGSCSFEEPVEDLVACQLLRRDHDEDRGARWR